MLKHLEEIKRLIEVCENGGAMTAQDRRDNTHDNLFDKIAALPDGAQVEMLALKWTGGPKNQSTFEENLALADKTRDENHAEILSARRDQLPHLLKEGLRRSSAN